MTMVSNCFLVNAMLHVRVCVCVEMKKERKTIEQLSSFCRMHVARADFRFYVPFILLGHSLLIHGLLMRIYLSLYYTWYTFPCLVYWSHSYVLCLFPFTITFNNDSHSILHHMVELHYLLYKANYGYPADIKFHMQLINATTFTLTTTDHLDDIMESTSF